MSDCSLLYGRSLLTEEVDVRLIQERDDLIRIKPAFTTVEGKKVCSRCSAAPDLSRAYPCTCGENCLYCRECINLGKVRECGQFYSIPEPNRFEQHARPYLKWSGTLSKQQKEASNAITESVRNNKDLLVWAVAGAGKTEMLFKALGDAMEAGKRVCITSPRIDVCLELAPRIQGAFPTVPMAVLYGGADESYVYTQLVIATTHQLYRFEEAFDVLIIDEVDAFPFHMNAALLFAAEKARKKRSSRICLTATPDQSMQKRVRKGKLEAVILPARYHGHALPVPKAVFHGGDLYTKKDLRRSRLIRHMKELTEKKKRFLLFIPTIERMEKLEPVLREVFKLASFACVHSKDPERREKVISMRKGELDFLLTTTILERGVTFENIDVLIWQSEHQVYTESALVQISGRAGRAKNHPTGNVTFYHQGWTRAMKRAMKQIRKMNQLAQDRGLIQ